MSLQTLYRMSVIMRLSNLVSGPMRAARMSINETESSLRKLQDTSKKWMASGGKMMAAGAAVGAAVMMPARATFQTQSALGELASVGIKDLDTLKRAGRDFSNEWAGTTTAQFVSAAYDIKSGISDLTDTGVAQFTTMAALTAKATRASTDEMTSLFATSWGIYRKMYNQLSDEAFGQMFSGGIASSVQQFKTDGVEMSRAISSLGAAATTANRPLEEQLAILGTLQATMSGSEAGTKYRSFIQNAVRAGDRLGMSFVDQNGQLMSMIDILQVLRQRYGESLSAMQKDEISRAFGTQEAVQLIDLLFPMMNELEDSILSVQGSMKGGLDLVKLMAMLQNVDPESQWTLLLQQLQNLREVVGEQLLDDFNLFTSKTRDIVTRITQWVEANPELIRSLGRVTGVLALLLVGAGGTIVGLGSLIGIVAKSGRTIMTTTKTVFVFGRSLLNIRSHLDTVRLYGMYASDTLRIGFGKVRAGAAAAGRGVWNLTLTTGRMAKQAAIAAVTGIKSMTLGLIQMARQGIMAAVRALPGLIAGVWGFTAALMANPITWIVLGIAALITILVLLWRNWDDVTAAFWAGWEWLKSMFSAGKDWVSEAITNMISAITTRFSEFRESGAALLQAFTDGLKSMVMKPYEVVKGGLSRLRNLLPFSDAKEGPLSSLTYSGQALVETFTSGIWSRRDSFRRTMAKILSMGGGGIDLDGFAFDGGGFGAPSPGMMGGGGSLSIREIIRERSTTRERETETEKKGPLVALHYHGGSRQEADDLVKSLEDWLSRNKK